MICMFCNMHTMIIISLYNNIMHDALPSYLLIHHSCLLLKIVRFLCYSEFLPVLTRSKSVLSDVIVSKHVKNAP